MSESQLSGSVIWSEVDRKTINGLMATGNVHWTQPVMGL